MRRLMLSVAVVLGLVLTGCESDEKKIERLRSELYAAEFPLKVAEEAAAKGQPQCPELMSVPTNVYLNACIDSLSKARTRAALVQREINKFMSGR